MRICQSFKRFSGFCLRGLCALSKRDGAVKTADYKSAEDSFNFFQRLSRFEVSEEAVFSRGWLILINRIMPQHGRLG
jgi:hypothetical protein